MNVGGGVRRQEDDYFGPTSPKCWADQEGAGHPAAQGGIGVLLATGDLRYLEDALDIGIASLRG
ncbi:hypothetical protein BH11ACT6_BH11ACT6_57830 [soil metagenome]